MSVALESLPREHPLRNTPLAEIGAEYRHQAGGPWKRVEPAYRIARCCFNDLGQAWTDGWTWRANSASGG